MALSKLLAAASLCLSFLLPLLSLAHQSVADLQRTPQEADIFQVPEEHNRIKFEVLFDCEGACEVRCSKSSRPELCERACGSCCRRCSCVPPGTSGNQKECPCYYNQITHGGKRKCP